MAELTTTSSGSGPGEKKRRKKRNNTQGVELGHGTHHTPTRLTSLFGHSFGTRPMKGPRGA